MSRVFYFLFFLSAGITACSDQDKKYITPEWMIQDRIKIHRKADDLTNLTLASGFLLIERQQENKLSGDAIPDAFKSVEPLLNFRYINPANFIPDTTTYILNVESLSIACRDHVEYVQFGTKYEISYERFVSQVRWSAETLEICGPMEIPEGHKLFIHTWKKTVLRDFALKLNENTFFALEASNPEYSGLPPNLDLNQKSILTLRFFKTNSENLK